MYKLDKNLLRDIFLTQFSLFFFASLLLFFFCVVVCLISFLLFMLFHFLFKFFYSCLDGIKNERNAEIHHWNKRERKKKVLTTNFKLIDHPIQEKYVFFSLHLAI